MGSKWLLFLGMIFSLGACTKKNEDVRSEVKSVPSAMHSSSEAKPLPCKDRVDIVYSVCLGKIKCSEGAPDCRQEGEAACKKSYDSLLLKCS